MSLFTPDIEAVRLWIALFGLAPLWQFFLDLRGSYQETMRQHARIRPWYWIFPLLFLKFVSVAGYRYGRSRDSHRIDDSTIVILGNKGKYSVKEDNGEEDRERRMGILGQPVPRHPTAKGRSIMTPRSSSIWIAVICPVYMTTLEDIDTLKRISTCLRMQSQPPDLVVFVDDCSPLGTPLICDNKSSQKHTITSKGTSCLTADSADTQTPDDAQYNCLYSSTSAVKTLVLGLPENLGPAAARNAGIDRAISELGNEPGSTILFLTDLDCLPPPDWISNGYQAITKRRPALGSGVADVQEPLVIGGITSGTASPS
ncbi:hypothetical protein NCC49_001360 [Naganishia albida]|nr:hypothetical protein NCC49_001360 [Naganishia albida]